MGSPWCETAASTLWAMIDVAATQGDCMLTTALVDRLVGAYAPASDWGKEVKATPAPMPTPTQSTTMAPAATAQPSKEAPTATKEESTTTKEEPTATKEGSTATRG